MLARPLTATLALTALVACGSDAAPVATDTSATSTPPTRSVSTTWPPASTATSTPTGSSSTTATSVPEADRPIPTTTEAADQPSGDQVAASEAFEAWVGHLGQGDHQAAWDAMAPTSKAAVGGRLFFASMV